MARTEGHYIHGITYCWTQAGTNRHIERYEGKSIYCANDDDFNYMIEAITHNHVKKGHTYLVKASHNVVKVGSKYMTKYGPMKGTNYIDLALLVERQVELARKNENMEIARTEENMAQGTYDVFIEDRAIFNKYFGQLVKDYGLTVKYHKETVGSYGHVRVYRWHTLHFVNK